MLRKIRTLARWGSHGLGAALAKDVGGMLMAKAIGEGEGCL